MTRCGCQRRGRRGLGDATWPWPHHVQDAENKATSIRKHIDFYLRSFKRRDCSGARIFAEGERGEEFFLIAKGQVQISRDDQTVALLGAGACFGEGALLHGRARSATATARLDCQLLRASGASFHYLLDRFPSMRAAIERIDTARQDGRTLRTGS